MKTPWQHWAVVNVRLHIRCGTDKPSFVTWNHAVPVICYCRCWEERWQLMLRKLNNWCLLLTCIIKCLHSHQLECILHVTCQRQWLLWSFLAALSVTAQETCPLSPLVANQFLVPFFCHHCQKWRKRSLVCSVFLTVLNAFCCSWSMHNIAWHGVVLLHFVIIPQMKLHDDDRLELRKIM